MKSSGFIEKESLEYLETSEIEAIEELPEDESNEVEAIRELFHVIEEREKNRFRSDESGATIAQLVGTFIDLFEQKILKEKWNLRVTIQDAMANIDRIIHQQLNEILHHKQMQRLEATWRGLYFMVDQVKGIKKKVRFRIFSAKKQELLRDFDRAVDFDQSNLFKMIYEAEFGTHGGSPFSIIVGDYEFSASPPDIALLKHLAAVSSAAHAPFISSAAPAMLDMDRFSELGIPKDLKKMFQRREWTQWNSFRKSEDSRYVVLTLPRVLLRLPYGRRKHRIHPGDIYLEEKVGGVHPDKYLWGNAAYILASRICDSFIKTGWFNAFSGLEDGGLVTNLPVPLFDTVEIPKMAVDVCIPDQIERELSNLGFICLQHRRWTTDCVFYGRQTVHLPKKHWTRKARANARLSAMLPHMLVASRFAHYIKTMIRTKIGSFKNREALEAYLNEWLAKYIVIDTGSSSKIQHEFPLREGRVDLVEAADTPGKFTAITYLRPHMQLEEVNASIRIFSQVTTRQR